MDQQHWPDISGDKFTVVKSELAAGSDESTLFEKMGKRLVQEFKSDVKGYAQLIYRGYSFHYILRYNGQKVDFGRDFLSIDVPVIVQNEDVFEHMITRSISEAVALFPNGRQVSLR
ncbi:hypothetical protein SAMN04487996_10442 [Dyadobacter soli]|uniref:Uncharacterized protein n=1 Tax=Dyadobacter soli TaxID=659014 RepID=A0A1G7B0R8_9BACT|nr:hypothetical protein [Dyadobacter soli]SDE20714.1 hypothetical protein SAMN04487996_10442 [Dyadobacter soli]